MWCRGLAPAPHRFRGLSLVTESAGSAAFLNTIYDVVRYDSATPDHIPAYLEPQFAAASAPTPGWYCSSATAKADLKNYGFLLSPLCGLAS